MCGCQRTTYLCQCRHKERRIERCHVYQLREAGSCWAYCFPKCQSKVRRYRLQRVCRDCESYFREKYGEEQYKKLIQLFLEYKEMKGWGKTAIDPRTVPREVLLKRQSAPPQLSSHTEGRPRARGQPFQVHRPMIMTTAPANRHQNERGLAPVTEHSYGQPRSIPIRRHGTPFCREPVSSSNSEAGTVASVRSVISSIKATFVPKVSGARAQAQRPEPLYIPSANKPLPADPSLFVVGDSEDEDDGDSDGNSRVDNKRAFSVEPKCLYDSSTLPLNFGIIPELAHLAHQGRRGKLVYPREAPELQHPVPRHYKVPRVRRNPESVSDCSIVKRLTKAARKLNIPNLDWEENEEGKLVPYIMSPLPGEPRTPTPPSSATSSEHGGLEEAKSYTFSEVRPIDIAIADNTVPTSLIPGRRGMAQEEAGRHNGGFAESPISYFVATSPDPTSPTGTSARVRTRSRSHQSVSVPPPLRLDGILVPPASACRHHPNKGKGKEDNPNADCKACRSSFFQERGLPSTTYIEQECRSATFEKKLHSPILVSVSAPARRYSCATQACCCEQFAELGTKCPPCRERDSIAKQLKSDWI